MYPVISANGTWEQMTGIRRSRDLTIISAAAISGSLPPTLILTIMINMEREIFLRLNRAARVSI